MGLEGTTEAYRDQGMVEAQPGNSVPELSQLMEPFTGARESELWDRFSLGRAAVPQMSKWKRLGWEAQALLV